MAFWRHPMTPRVRALAQTPPLTPPRIVPSPPRGPPVLRVWRKQLFGVPAVFAPFLVSWVPLLYSGQLILQRGPPLFRSRRLLKSGGC
jgi:hypothetical protein